MDSSPTQDRYLSDMHDYLSSLGVMNNISTLLSSSIFIIKIYIILQPEETRCTLADLEEGRIGKLRIHRSGRVTMLIGDAVFEVSGIHLHPLL